MNDDIINILIRNSDDSQYVNIEAYNFEENPMSMLLNHCANVGSYSGCVKKDIKAMKNYFFNYGLLYLFENKAFETHNLGLGLYSFMYPLLSDNRSLINLFVDIDEVGYEKSINEGEVFTKCIQSFLKNDLEDVRRCLKIIDSKTLKREEYKNMRFEYEFFIALYERNYKRIKNTIINIENSPFHEERQGIFRNYYFMPQTTLAKLSWILGIQIDFDSPIIPREWLPIQPLDKYSIRYKFLHSSFA